MGDQNPRQYREQNLHDKRVTVWVGLCADYSIESFFFEDDYGKAISVNGVGYRYRNMLNTFLRGEIENSGLEDY